MTYKTFGFSEEQTLMRDSLLGLLTRALPDERIRALEAAGDDPADAYQALAAAGWLGLPFAETHGGAAASYKDLAVFVEALSYHHNGLRAAYMTSVIYGGMSVQYHGAAALGAELIPRVISGAVRMAVSYSDPSSGSDAAAIRTRAVRDGDGYVLNGQKVFTTNAHVADYLVVTAKTDADAGRRGISLFVVDAKAPGMEIRPMAALGARTSPPNEVFIDAVRVPADHLLGEENDGWSRLMQSLNLERLLIAAASAGQCLKILEIASAFAKHREAFGQPITNFQAISHKLADLQMMMESARLATFHAANMLDAGEDAVLETTNAKVIASENNVACADLGMRVMAGAGYVEGDMQRLYRDSRAHTIGGGTSDVLRNVIAKRMGL
ncbi:MAG: acyl-CoA dehydrogenase family protein [Proteobacteria bacterium]|nr:acyl-CoA dehydrogenase family protein [Pseudomonadota bacterium]